MKNREPWPGSFVGQMEPSAVNVRDLEQLLAKAEDERPIQEYLATVPSFFRKMLASCPDVWCFDRLQLGAEYVPDFLLCCRFSFGYSWVLVELESPKVPALNQSGRPSSKLNEAMGQIRDWRAWLRQNISYAQTQRGLSGINAECEAWIVIGRRAMTPPEQLGRYRELTTQALRVMSYDRILESAKA